MDSTKNGNREGIRVLIQMSMPAAAPAIAVLLSRIRMTMHTATTELLMVLRMFNVITSKESMPGLENSAPKIIYIFQRGCMNGAGFFLDAADG